MKLGQLRLIGHQNVVKTRQFLIKHWQPVLSFRNEGKVLSIWRRNMKREEVSFPDSLSPKEWNIYLFQLN